jgi:multidrug transporter EmrE-like cation transporter
LKTGFRLDPRLRQLGDSPLLLLLVTGALLGSMLPMSRLARASGWSPLAFAFWPALGSGLRLPLLVASDGLLAPGLSGWNVLLAQCLFTSLGDVLSATGVVSGLLFFDEHLTVPTLVAVAIIMAGIWLVNPRPQEART